MDLAARPKMVRNPRLKLKPTPDESYNWITSDWRIMAFGHRKKRNEPHQDSMWTSYSDLFLGLSIVFLLLYVTSSIRQGTDGIQKHIEYKQLVKENEDIKQQLRIYTTLKDNYIENHANPDEQKDYEELMNKLNLLQDEAKTEKMKLEEQALENGKKAQALNKYQQMIRNIIQSNVIAKSRIKERDTVIDKNETVITQQDSEIKGLEKQIFEKQEELNGRTQQISNLEIQLKDKLEKLQKSYKAQHISKKNFEKQKLQLQEQAKAQIGQLKARTDQLSSELNQAQGRLQKTTGELGLINKKLQQTTGELGSAKNRLAQTAGELDSTKNKLNMTKEELARANENLNAKKKLVAQIKDAFRKKGIKSDVDEKSGDVLLDFGDSYFATGRSDLRAEMKKILEKAIPAYSSSLFEDPNIAKRIQSVEIVGFASPTYNGRFIDPRSMKPEDRSAINFNLDLSYNRAKSIFGYVFDKKKMQFKHQDQLLKLVKVTGRSFFDQVEQRAPTSKDAEEFCKVNDCAKLQRVIIKFNLKD